MDKSDDVITFFQNIFVLRRFEQPILLASSKLQLYLSKQPLKTQLTQLELMY